MLTSGLHTRMQMHVHKYTQAQTKKKRKPKNIDSNLIKKHKQAKKKVSVTSRTYPKGVPEIPEESK